MNNKIKDDHPAAAEDNTATTREKQLEEAYTLVLGITKKYLGNFGLSHSIGEDVVSEVMLKLVQRPDKLAQIENIRAYLFVMVRHELNHYLLKAKPLRSLDNEDQPLDIADPRSGDLASRITARIDAQKLVSEVIVHLPPLEKKIFAILQSSDLSHINKREIARKLKQEDPKVTRYKSDKALEHLLAVIKQRLVQ